VSTRHRQVEELREAYLAMEADQHKAPEQVEAARRAWLAAARELRESDMPPTEHTCGNDNVPFCSACDAERGTA
jgi:hypothetical protein